MLKFSGVAAAALLAAGAAHAGKTPPVFVIALENHNFTQPAAFTELQQIKGNPAAPFINSLLVPGNWGARFVSYATRYLNVPPQKGHPVHPSEPNYVWAESGFPGQYNDDDPFPNNIVNKPSLCAEMQAAGMSWKSYQEGTDLVTVNGQLTNTVAPQDQWTVPLVSFSGTSPTYVNPYNGSHQYQYAAKHNPQVFFLPCNGGDDTTPANPQSLHFAPMEQLQADLANDTVAQYNWITPDEFNDMHSSLRGGFTYNGVHYTGDVASIAQGDNFLSHVVPMIEKSHAFKKGGIIVIWDDEAEGDTSGVPGRYAITEIVISKGARGNAYHTSIAYNHGSDLLSWQNLFGLSPANGYKKYLGGSAYATPLDGLFQTGFLTTK